MNEKLAEEIKEAQRVYSKTGMTMDVIVWENYWKDEPKTKTYGFNFGKRGRYSEGQSFDEAWGGVREIGACCKVMAVINLPSEFTQALNQIETLIKERGKNCLRATDLDTIFERILFRSNWCDDDSEWEIREVFLSLTGCSTHGFLNDENHKWIAVVSGRHIELRPEQIKTLEAIEMGDNI